MSYLILIGHALFQFFVKPYIIFTSGLFDGDEEVEGIKKLSLPEFQVVKEDTTKGSAKYLTNWEVVAIWHYYPQIAYGLALTATTSTLLVDLSLSQPLGLIAHGVMVITIFPLALLFFGQQRVNKLVRAGMSLFRSKKLRYRQ